MAPPSAHLDVRLRDVRFRGKADMGNCAVSKFFDARINKFGFIVPDDAGSDVFVHANTLGKAGIDDLTPGQRVRFVVGGDRKGNRPRVIEIELLEEKAGRVNKVADILDVANADFYLSLNSCNILVELPITGEPKSP